MLTLCPRSYCCIAMVTLLLISCGGPSQPEHNEEDGVEQAWILYHSGDWSASLQAFGELLAGGDAVAEAYIGSGYCQLHLHLLAEAASSFNTVVNLNPWLVESRAGLLFARRELHPVDYEQLREEAAAIMQIDPNWIFQHEESINWRDLFLIRAQSSFYLGDLSNCLWALRAIDPELALNESDSSSWLPWTTFTEALFHTLEDYTLLYGDD